MRRVRKSNVFGVAFRKSAKYHSKVLTTDRKLPIAGISILGGDA